MILYLDIDGVMVPANSWRKPEFLEDGFAMFSLKAVDSLNKILSKTKADIVLTTSHKHLYSIKEWKDIFKRRDIKVNKISRLPKNIDNLNRKDELLIWFNTNRLKDNFIIIDDDKSLNALPKKLKDRVLLTCSSIGLTEREADEVLDLIAKSNFKIAN